MPSPASDPPIGGFRRRTLLGSTAAGLGTALLASCRGETKKSSAPAGGAQPRVRWQMATSWPHALDTMYGAAETICRRVGELSRGRFEIRPFAAGELVPGLEVMEAVRTGAVSCGHTASYYYLGKNPAFAFATALPFGLTAQQQNAWLYEGGGNQAIDRLYGDHGIKAFPAGNTGAQMGGWFKRKVQSVADLQGLKMRIPGLGGKVMAELGVNVQVLPGGEIYLALERGAIDAAEWTGPYDDTKLGLNRAARYYYYPGWWEPGPSLHLLVNRAAFDQLPAEYQAMLEAACVDANLSMLSRYEVRNSQALGGLLKGGTELVPYSPEIFQAARQVAFQLYDDFAASNPDFRRIYKEWRQFRRQIYDWNRVNELAFSSFAFEQREGA